MPFANYTLKLAMDEIIDRVIGVRIHSGDPGVNGTQNEISNANGVTRGEIAVGGWTRERPPRRSRTPRPSTWARPAPQPEPRRGIRCGAARTSWRAASSPPRWLLPMGPRSVLRRAPSISRRPAWTKQSSPMTQTRPASLHRSLGYRVDGLRPRLRQRHCAFALSRLAWAD